MKKLMFSISFISLFFVLVCIAIYVNYNISFIYSLAITFGTVFYHFSMRLIVGYIINATFKNQMNYKRKEVQHGRKKTSTIKII